MLELNSHEFTKSKKDNIYQLHMNFSNKCWGIGLEYIENNKLVINIESCDETPLLEVEFRIPGEIINSFEYMDYTISKNKDELYVLFYEYPYEDDDIEVVYSDSPRVVRKDV